MKFPATVEGGCHCGSVRFRVTLHCNEVLDCNCSVCTKKGLLHAIASKEDFVLLQGKDVLTTYRFNTGVAQHTFCSKCGVQPFYVPRSHPNMVDTNPRCFDGNVLQELRVVPFDGSNWEQNVESITE